MTKIRITATYVFDAKDPNTDEIHVIYRCDMCKALIESADVQDHLAWHSTLTHTSAAVAALEENE